MISFVFIDSGDGTGKSTSCDILVNNIIPEQKFCEARKVVLPRECGPLGFLRKHVKDSNFEADDFARQLLHCCSHIEAFESLPSDDIISQKQYKSNIYYIFDRGPLSTMVYGSFLIKNKIHQDILRDININVLISLIDRKILDSIHFVLLEKDKPYRTEDNSYYEKVTNFEQINKLYSDKFKELRLMKELEGKRVLFSRVKIEEGTGRKEVAQKIWKEILTA